MRPALRSLVFLSLIATFAFAGPEVPVGKSVFGPAPGDRWSPSVATEGSDYLVAWLDGRTMSSQRVMATRIARDGDLLDRTGILVADEPAYAPKAVWTGNTYLVLWSNGQTSGPLRAATVDRDGKVAAPRTLAQPAVLMAAGQSGNTTMVIYASGTSLRAVLLDRDANVTNDVVIAEGNGRGDVTIASNGSEFLVAWYVPSGTSTDVEVVRVARNGTVIGTPRNVGPGVAPRLASDGTDYVLVSRRHHTGEFTWSSRSLSADLSTITPPVPLPQGNVMDQPSLLWNGSEYVFFAQRFPLAAGVPFQLAAVRIGRNGRPIDDALEVQQFDASGGVAPGTSAITNGSSILAAWIESTQTEDSHMARVVARRYSATSLDGLGNGLLLSLSSNRQITPAAAFDASSTALVVWRETKGLYASRISAAGESLDGRGIKLTDAVLWTAPKVVFDGIQFVVAWLDNTNLEIRFITPAGEVLADEIRLPNVNEFALKNGFKGPTLAWTDTEFRLWATRIDRETRQPDAAPLAISPEGELAGMPALAWNGRETLVVWSKLHVSWWHGTVINPLQINGARLSSAFTVIDTAPIAIGHIRQRSNANPAVSSNGDDWLVTWISGETELRANRVLRNGAVTGAPEGTLLARGGHMSVSADVVFDRTSYAIAFKRDRELFTAWVPSTGPIVVNGLASLGNTKSDQREISITRTGTSVVVAYARVSDAPEHAGVEKAFIRSVAPGRKVRAVR